jgi:hypothetical protein
MSDPFDFSRYAVRGQDPASAPLPGGESSGSHDAPLGVGHPPLVWLAVALAFAIIAILLAQLVIPQNALTILPWFLAGPVAMGALALFNFRDTAARALPVYAETNGARVLHVATVIGIVVAVAVTALHIALWVGRL